MSVYRDVKKSYLVSEIAVLGSCSLRPVTINRAMHAYTIYQAIKTGAVLAQIIGNTKKHH